MRLRALTYNVHKCIGGIDRRYDPERVAEVIAHYAPDLVLLQEVAQNSAVFRNERQVERLGDMLGLRHRTFYVNVRFKGGVEYGNAILSRFPLTETSNESLKIPGKKARSVLHARFRVRIEPGRRAQHGSHQGAAARALRASTHARTLHVFNMHLGLSGLERKIQLRRFLAARPFAGLDQRTPILVGGDLNDVWGSLGRVLAPAGFRGAPHPTPTYPAFAPVRALDSIYVRGALELHGVQRARLALARQASDHLPLIADLEILPARTPGAR